MTAGWMEWREEVNRFLTLFERLVKALETIERNQPNPLDVPE